MPENENKSRTAAIRGEDWLWAFCKKCGRSKRLDQMWAIHVASRTLRREGIAKRLRCKGCGARAAVVVWADVPMKR